MRVRCTLDDDSTFFHYGCSGHCRYTCFQHGKRTPLPHNSAELGGNVLHGRGGFEGMLALENFWCRMLPKWIVESSGRLTDKATHDSHLERTRKSVYASLYVQDRNTACRIQMLCKLFLNNLKHIQRFVPMQPICSLGYRATSFVGKNSTIRIPHYNSRNPLTLHQITLQPRYLAKCNQHTPVQQPYWSLSLSLSQRS